MSKRTLSPQDQRILLAEAGGQCELEGCPEFIYEPITPILHYFFHTA